MASLARCGRLWALRVSAPPISAAVRSPVFLRPSALLRPPPRLLRSPALLRPYSSSAEEEPLPHESSHVPQAPKPRQMPPFAAALRDDLKTALRDKDETRKSVVRAVIAAIEGSHIKNQGTFRPIETDLQLFNHLTRMKSKQLAAAADFTAAGRHDLVENERAQIAILDEYRTRTKIVEVSKEELDEIVRTCVTKIRDEQVNGALVKTGDALKAVERVVEGKSMDKSVVMQLIAKYRKMIR